MYIENKVNMVKEKIEINPLKEEEKTQIIYNDGKVIREKSLLDYLILSKDKSDEIFPSEIYTKSVVGDDYIDNNKQISKDQFVELNKREEVIILDCKTDGKYDEYWFKTKHGTRQFHWDEKKLDLCIKYWMDNGSIIRTAPCNVDFPPELEGDDQSTKNAYWNLATYKAGKAISECCLLKTFKELGLEDANISVDWKGEFSVESENDIDKEAFDKVFNSKWDFVRVFRDLMPKCSKMSSMSSEEKQDFMEATGYRWNLYRNYNLRAEDLKIKDNGEIEGLNEKFLEEFGTDFDKPYYDIYRRAIRCGGDSDEIMVTMKVKNGKLYIK